MINIAVLVFDLTVEYNIVVVDGICDFFKSKQDVHVIISTINAPHNEEFQYDYQYWTGLEILKSDNVDAVIVVSNSFCHNLTVEQLAKELKCLMPKPVISVSVPLKLPTNRYTCISCEDAYNEIVGHLKNKHKRSKIAFLSASLTTSPESEEREAAFRKAMKNHKLEVNENWIFAGDFSPGSAYDCFKNRFGDASEVPFDALLCANDYMAAGAEVFFRQNRIQIPEQVCVFGFDDAEVAINSTPSLSTINQKVIKTGYKAAELAYNVICGNEAPKSVTIQAIPLYRQSCGCMDKSLGYRGAYDASGKYHEREARVTDALALFGNGSMSDLATIYHVLNITDSVTLMNEFFSIAVQNLDVVNGIKMLAICVYDEAVYLSSVDTFEKPDKAKLLMFVDKEKGIENNYYNQGGIEFNPNKLLLPNGLEDLSSGDYLLLPIFLQEKNYGYLICKLPNHKYPVYTIFLKLLINSFVHSYTYSKKEEERAELAEENQTLNFQSKTDELTKLFNRRGFMEYGQQLLDIAAVSNENGCVFFCDLDGLKQMNDTWGHETGDLAIKTESMALRAAFRDSDMVGRLSGDEFGVVAPRFPISKLPDLRKRLSNLNEQFSKDANLPFTLSISIGVVEFTVKKSNLQELLKEADKNMYKEKKVKHAKRAAEKAALEK
ncbi:MAG: GGDEF domain-containing protein [Treponema sp.]|nr:GGDEF domain-containing protein [Treponema sp.]